MATRKAQVIINVDDKSLTQLNAEMQELQSSIDGLTIGTEEWIEANKKLGDLKRQFSEAGDAAGKLQGQIEKISGPEQLQAFSKLGAGMVGAFTAGSQALKLFGAESKAFDELTARATSLMAIMGGLNQVSETFSKDNVKRLKSMGKGFLNLGKTVKAASSTMKIALASTGILLLVVAVAALAANWEKVISVLDGSRRSAKKTKEQNEDLLEGIELQNSALEEQLRLTDELRKYERDLYIPPNTLSTNLDNQNKALQAQIDLKQYLLDFGKKSEIGSKAAHDKAMERLATEERALRGLQLSRESDLVRSATDKQIKKQERKVELAQLEYDIALKNQTTTETEIHNLNIQLLFNKKYLHTREQITDDLKDMVKWQQIDRDKLAEKLVILQAQERKEHEIYLNRKKDLEIQIKQWDDIIDKEGVLTNQEKARHDLLKAQLKALTERDRIQQRDYKRQQEQVQFDRDQLELTQQHSVELADQSIVHTQIYNNLISIGDAFDLNNDKIDFQLGLLKREEELYKGQREHEEKLTGLKDRGYENRIKALEMEEYFYNRSKEFDNERLRNEQLILQNKKDLLLLEQQSLENKIANTDKTKEELENDLARGEELFKQADTNEKRLAAEQQIAAANTSIRDLNQEILDLKNEQLAKANEMAGIEFKVAKTTEEIADNNEDIAIKTEETTDNITQQEALWSKLGGFVGDYGEEIAALNSVITNSLSLVAAAFDRKAADAAEELNDLRAEYDELNDAEQDRLERISELEELRADANGEYYDDLTDQINVLKGMQDENYVDEVTQENNLLKLQYEQDKAEYQAAKWRKSQGIIDGIIQTALAVIKSLPNVFLSIASGVAGAASVATIATQKLPPKPEEPDYKTAEFAVGGFTGRGSPKKIAGVVHKDEYVVPSKVMNSQSGRSHVAALEKQRVRGYAGGGLVKPIGETADSGMDYQKFGDILIKAMESLPPSQVSLVAVSNGIRDVELTKQNSGLNR